MWCRITAYPRAGNGVGVGAAAARRDGQVDEAPGAATQGARSTARGRPQHARANARPHRQAASETQDLQATDRRRGNTHARQFNIMLAEQATSSLS